MAKFRVMHSQIHMDTQEDGISRDHRAKIQEILDLTNLVLLTLIILGVARTMVAIRGEMQQALVDKIRIIFLVTEVMGTNQGEHHSTNARFNERYNKQYSPPMYPPAPSLNSSFLEALSKSIIADSRKPI